MRNVHFWTGLLIGQAIGLIVGMLIVSRAHADIIVAPDTVVTITWTQGEGVVPTAYSLERRIGSAAYTVLADTASVSSTDTITGSDPYLYRVRAYKALSNGSKLYGAYSDESEPVSASGAPGKPGCCTVTVP